MTFVRDESCTRVAVWRRACGAPESDAWSETLREAALLTAALHAGNAPGRSVRCVCVLHVPDTLTPGWRDVVRAMGAPEHDGAPPASTPGAAAAPPPPTRIAVIPVHGSTVQHIAHGTSTSKWLDAVVRAAVNEDTPRTPQSVLPPRACRAPSVDATNGDVLSWDQAAALAAQWTEAAPATAWSDVFSALDVDAIAFLSASQPCVAAAAAPPLVPWLAPRDTMVHSMHAALAFAPPHVRARVCVIDAGVARAPHLPACGWVQAPPASRGTGALTAAAAATATNADARGVPAAEQTNSTTPYAAVHPDVPCCTPLYGSAARRACLLFLLQHGVPMRDAVLHFSG